MKCIREWRRGIMLNNVLLSALTACKNKQACHFPIIWAPHIPLASVVLEWRHLKTWKINHKTMCGEMPGKLRGNICIYVTVATGYHKSVCRCQSVGQSIVLQICFWPDSGYVRSLWAALFRLLWHSLRVLRCFLSASLILSAWKFRRDQTCRSCSRRLGKGHCVLTQHGVHWPFVYVCWCGKHNVEDRK